jgi:broad-specificity NMP kinase
LDRYTKDYDEMNEIAFDFFKSYYPKRLNEVKNKSLVIDSNLDKNYSIFFDNYVGKLCKRPFIILIDIPYATTIRRLKKRGFYDKPRLNKLLSNLPVYVEAHEQFKKKMKNHIHYEIHGEITEEVLEDMYSKILEFDFE